MPILCRIKTSEKIFTFCIENAELCCCGATDPSASISLQNVKKPVEKCSFLGSFGVTACSFNNYKTPSQVFFTVCNKMSRCLCRNTLQL